MIRMPIVAAVRYHEDNLASARYVDVKGFCRRTTDHQSGVRQFRPVPPYLEDHGAASSAFVIHAHIRSERGAGPIEAIAELHPTVDA